MRTLNLIPIFLLSLSAFTGCTDESDKLPNGFHKAYVECFDTKTDKQTDFAAQIEVKGGLVKKIIKSKTDSIDNFNFWIKKDSKSQEAYSTGDEVYTVHIIPDN